MYLLNSPLPRTSHYGGILVGAVVGDSGGEQETQGVQFAVEALVGLH
jgi:hypothetical protein